MTQKSLLDDYLEGMSSLICTELRKSNPEINQRHEDIATQKRSLHTAADAFTPLLWPQMEALLIAQDLLAGEEIKAAYLRGAADFAAFMANVHPV